MEIYREEPAEVVNNTIKGSVLKFTNEHLKDPRHIK